MFCTVLFLQTHSKQFKITLKLLKLVENCVDAVKNCNETVKDCTDTAKTELKLVNWHKNCTITD